MRDAQDHKGRALQQGPLTIDTHVPVPTPRNSAIYRTLLKMNVGHSFAVPYSKTTQRQAHNAAARVRKDEPGFSITTRREIGSDNIRIWRAK